MWHPRLRAGRFAIRGGCSIGPLPVVDMVGRTDLNVGAGGELSPKVSIAGRITRVLAEQTAAVDPNRLGESSGHLTFEKLRRFDAARRLVLDL